MSILTKIVRLCPFILIFLYVEFVNEEENFQNFSMNAAVNKKKNKILVKY